MANIKELRGRIRSVKSIAQITRAMEMVASMKLRKVQARAIAHDPYARELRGVVRELSASSGEDAERRLFRPRPVSTTGVFLVTSDRGLCGSYNTNLLSRFHEVEDDLKGRDPARAFKLYVYGRRGFSYLHRRSFDVARFFAEPQLDKAGFEAARLVADALVDDFLGGVIDEVKIIYTRYTSPVRFEPTVIDFLPIGEVAEAGKERGYARDFLIEPDSETVLDLLVPKYLETIVWDAMLQSLTCEHAARRMAMKGATDAASSMLKDLRRVYNRARQENITKELLDIIGGANAVG